MSAVILFFFCPNIFVKAQIPAKLLTFPSPVTVILLARQPEHEHHCAKVRPARIRIQGQMELNSSSIKV